MSDAPQLLISPFTRRTESARWSAAALRITETETGSKQLLVGNADYMTVALRALLGEEFAMPVRPNTTLSSSVGACIWLNPSQWLLLTSAVIAEKVRCAFAQPESGSLGAVFDVSARFTQMTIAGARAADFLSVGCSLDFRTSTFEAGRCAQTRIEQIPVILYRRTLTEFELLVERSLAAYLWRWVQTAAEEFITPELK
jgi:heterotetrameric sarcosine oxidase gamma subunit